MLWPSTPAAPWFRASFRHAASRVVGRTTLSIRLYHLPPHGSGRRPARGHALTPLPRADTMRSVQTDASAHHHCPRRRASAPCVALSGTPEAACCVIPDLAPPTSCLPSLGAVLLPVPSAAHRGIGTMKALTPADLTPTGRSLRLPRLAVPAFRPQPRKLPAGRFVRRLSAGGRFQTSPRKGRL